jgi:phage head maturation protease
MSGKHSEPKPTRRGFAAILGGVAAGAILGTTAVANATDGGGSGSIKETGSKTPARKSDLAGVQALNRHDIEGLARKLDALNLSDKERGLLVALLGVATNTIVRNRTEGQISPLVETVGSGKQVGVRTDGPATSIREQFRSAFRPGAFVEGDLGELGEVIIHDPV